MRIGLVADIHEEVELLNQAIAQLRSISISEFIILGDVFETGRRIDETVAIRSVASGPIGNNNRPASSCAVNS